jgi:hypothetical protein
MLKPFLFIFKNLREKSIPRGGLGKRVLDDFVERVLLPTSSLSHAVG